MLLTPDPRIISPLSIENIPHGLTLTEACRVRTAMMVRAELKAVKLVRKGHPRAARAALRLVEYNREKLERTRKPQPRS